MNLGPYDLTRDVMVVAEIGNNHEGDPALAAEMVRQAARAGADAIKLQVFKTEHYVSRIERERFERLKSFELSYGDIENLANLTHELNKILVATPFDLESAAMLRSVADVLKISSGDVTFLPLVKQIAADPHPLFVSTGMSSENEIAKCVSWIEEIRGRQERPRSTVLLHCVSAYPTPLDDAHLACIPTLRDTYGGIVGYSDHTLGIEACVSAVCLGARVIEKHFTLNKEHSSFRDHQLSADVEELSELVQRVRQCQRMLGTGTKGLLECEVSTHRAARRSIVARHELLGGHLLTLDDLDWVRPGGGLAPGQESLVVGRRVLHRIKPGEMIIENRLESLSPS